MQRPDLVFLTKENQAKLAEVAEGIRQKQNCPICGFDSFGPHDCPGAPPHHDD